MTYDAFAAPMTNDRTAAPPRPTTKNHLSLRHWR